MFLGLSNRPYQTSHEGKVDKNLVENQGKLETNQIIEIRIYKGLLHFLDMCRFMKIWRRWNVIYFLNLI